MVQYMQGKNILFKHVHVKLDWFILFRLVYNIAVDESNFY